MREEFNPLIKSCGTRTDPAAETKSIGLQADARVVMVFASPSGQFYCDMTNPAHLSGQRHLDSFILTPNFRSSTGTLQKHMPTLTLTATNQTAGPLAQISRYVMISQRAVFELHHLDNINATSLSGLAIARQ